MSRHIREEAPGDRSAIRAVVTAAFGRPDEADLVDRLRNDGDLVLSLVDVEENGIAGHALLSRMTAPFRTVALAPVSVVPQCQRRGIGSALICAALDRAAAEGWRAAVVLGEPAFYRRFGFDAAAARGFDCSYAGPFLMIRALRGPLPARNGRLQHAPAFDGLD